MCNEQFELEKQLHEQYAINNNASISSFVSFIVAIFALFGSFGYVFVYSSIEFSVGGKFVVNNIMTLDIFLLFSVMVAGIMLFISLISLQLGYSNRNNQIIINNIRNRYFDKNKDKIFGNNYNPLDKKWFDFIQDYFNNFYWMFFSGQILVLLFTLIKIKSTICSIYFTLIIITHFSLIISTLWCRHHYYKKYKKAIK